MGLGKIALDSNIIIYLLKGNRELQKIVAEYDEMAREFMSYFRIVSLSDEIAELAVKQRREYKLKIPNAIILAVAQINKCKLLTFNSKDYRKFDSEVIIPEIKP